MGSQSSLPEVDLADKTIVVTGANTGIGYETAKSLAQVGAKVILACRSEPKAQEAIDQMKKEHAEEKADPKKQKIKINVDDLSVEFMALDLGSLQSTMTFIEAYKNTGRPLHVLICNAGIMWGPEELTSDGYEPHFQINYLSHFLLILHLLPVLKSSGPCARVVSVSSLMYRFASWNAADLQCLKNNDRGKRYANSKLYQVMHMFSLAQRLEGSGVDVFSLHPGVVKTELTTREGQSVPGLTKLFVRNGGKMIRTPFEGALTSLHAAADPAYDNKTALYFESSKPHSVNSTARNKDKQEIIWKYSLECLSDHITDEAMKVFTSK
ncbi:retinol dehydrogenase 12-like [Lytechinus pictus]|uniref:retinol dehydrogenase 12-like n=1 Tax=Lytechinus pictus TaxID=7653 RepID=UPI0030B9E41B